MPNSLTFNALKRLVSVKMAKVRPKMALETIDDSDNENLLNENKNK